MYQASSQYRAQPRKGAAQGKDVRRSAAEHATIRQYYLTAGLMTHHLVLPRGGRGEPLLAIDTVSRLQVHGTRLGPRHPVVLTRVPYSACFGQGDGKGTAARSGLTQGRRLPRHVTVAGARPPPHAAERCPWSGTPKRLRSLLNCEDSGRPPGGKPRSPPFLEQHQPPGFVEPEGFLVLSGSSTSPP
jgi:hypothetical protein